ncbi:MAG: peptide chain release factor N(5)-glutamine methyltransferase [Longimicrobiales bacterium]
MRESQARERPTPVVHSDPTPPAPGDAWTVMHMVRWSTAYLDERQIEGPRLDAEMLLAHALGTERLQLYLQFDRPLTAGELKAYKPLLKRRAAREPIQYILGSTPFRTLELSVDPRALIPRPETEFLLDVILQASGSHPFSRALDVGTGTGAIALSLAAEKLAHSVCATDVSEEALELARANAERNDLEGVVDFRVGPCTVPFDGQAFDLIVSNPPYVPDQEWEETAPEVRDWEPSLALKGGHDGLDMVRTLIQEVPAKLKPGGWLALELASPQTTEVEEALRAEGNFAEAQTQEDLTGRTRYVLARKR